MRTLIPAIPVQLFALALSFGWASAQSPTDRHTQVSIQGDDFYLNGQPTYAGRSWNGHRIEGLLLNARMVQGIFDDLNPQTVRRWNYPDTGKWDADRNTSEFIAAMPEWRKHGLLAFTLNLPGGSPEGYSHGQPWRNSAFDPDGSLRADYFARLAHILDRADELGMVVILGYFYGAQDGVLTDETAVLKAVDNATGWLLDHGYRNVMVENYNFEKPENNFVAAVGDQISIIRHCRHHSLSCYAPDSSIFAVPSKRFFVPKVTLFPDQINEFMSNCPP